MAESLNDFFVNIGAYLLYPNNKIISIKLCTDLELQMIIGNLKSPKASGPNTISANLLIEFSELLINPLAAIINMSFKEGIFPSLNKQATICLIDKMEDTK